MLMSMAQVCQSKCRGIRVKIAGTVRDAFASQGVQERSRTSGTADAELLSNAAARGVGSEAPTGGGRTKTLSFSLGKLGLRYEVQEPEVDVEALAQAALQRYEREQESAFRTELEIAALRNSLAVPPALEGAAGGQAALPQSEAPSPQLQRLAIRAYESHTRTHAGAVFRPGVHIGQV